MTPVWPSGAGLPGSWFGLCSGPRPIHSPRAAVGVERDWRSECAIEERGARREFVGVSVLGGSVAAVGESAGKAMNAGACQDLENL